MSIDIGEKLKDLRIKNGLTQEELADRAELSKGFISQLERNLTSPSISTLEDLLQCLGVCISEFFADDTDDQIVFTEEDYFSKSDSELGNMVEWVIPNAQKNMMEPVIMCLEKGGASFQDNPHEGEEFGYVLSGEISLNIGLKKYDVKAGESFYFTPDKPHFIVSEKGARILWISTPPSF
jgi:transcriptional regulator with XRE-family HTH domain